MTAVSSHPTSCKPPISALLGCAADAQLQDGEVYRLESSRAGFPVKVRREDGLHPEVVILPKGGSGVYGGWCPNALIEAKETDFGAGACFYEEPVRFVLSSR